MFASRSQTTITLSDGETVTIRKLSEAEWLQCRRLMRDARAPTAAQADADRAADAVDLFVLSKGVVAWSVPDVPVGPEAFADLTHAAATAIVEAILRHTDPDLWASPQTIEVAAKNESGGAATSSTETPVPPMSGATSVA